MRMESVSMDHKNRNGWGEFDAAASVRASSPRFASLMRRRINVENVQIRQKE